MTTYGVGKRIQLLSEDGARLSPTSNTAVKNIEREPEWDTPYREPEIVIVVGDQVSQVREDRQCAAGSVAQRDDISEIEVSKNAKKRSRSSLSFRSRRNESFVSPC